jgi:ELWxxDGT repeat protein
MLFTARTKNRRRRRPRLEELADRCMPAQTAVLVEDINVGSSPFLINGPGSNPAQLTDVDGTLYFTATDGVHGVELWRSDGTEAGTYMVKDIRVGSGHSSPQELTVVGDVLYFTADDGVSDRRLWRTDGTEAGTSMVHDYFGGTFDHFDFSELTSFNGDLFFKANARTDSGNTGRELWRVETQDGFIHPSVAGIPGSAAVDPSELAVVVDDGTSFLYFAGNTEASGRELWRSDGTIPGTGVFNIRSPGSSNPTKLTASGEALYFVANNGVHGVELWRLTNGVARLVRDIRTGGNSSLPNNLTDVNGVLYFTANDGVSGDELWGTVGGEFVTANLVRNIRPAGAGSMPAVVPTSFVNVGGILYFAANDGTNGTELWRSDGSSAGTTMVRNIRSGSRGSAPTRLTSVNGTLFFTANNGSSGEEVWISDGTEAGTRMLRDIDTRILTGSSPTWLTNVNGTLYFAARSRQTGNELWRSRENELHTLVSPDNQSSEENDSITLPISVINPDGDPLRFSASNLPPGLTINQTTGVISGVIGAHAGRTRPYHVSVWATDGFETAGTSFDWSVSDSTAPTIFNPGPLRNNEGNFLQHFRIDATDLEGDPLTFRAEGLPAGLQVGIILNPNYGILYGTIGPQAAVNGNYGDPRDGIYEVTVYASDGFNEVGTTFLWTIGDVTGPVLAA